MQREIINSIEKGLYEVSINFVDKKTDANLRLSLMRKCGVLKIILCISYFIICN